MKENIIIFGTGGLAEIAYEYFKVNYYRNVIAFTATTDCIDSIEFCGLPIIDFEEIENIYDPEDNYNIFVAIGYADNNKIRQKFLTEVLKKGYKTISYISPDTFIWSNVTIEKQNNFIFENNTIQPFVDIGFNNIFWSGNHIGHHSQIDSHNFFSSHVVIAGYCSIGCNNFFGVNSTIIDNIKIGDNCIIGAGALVLKDVPDNSKVIGIWK